MADIVVAPTRAFSPRSLRLDTLVRLRWLAVGGQALAVLAVRFVLAFPLPTTLCLLLIGLSAGLNLVLRARYPATLRLGQWPAFALLAYDVVQLGGLLFLTGGLENPFAILLLAPVIVSAAALASRPTAALGLLVIATATVLAVFHWQLPWYPAESLVGKKIVIVANLAPRAIRGNLSHGMLLAAENSTGSEVVLLTLDKDLPAGSLVR